MTTTDVLLPSFFWSMKDRRNRCCKTTQQEYNIMKKNQASSSSSSSSKRIVAVVDASLSCSLSCVSTANNNNINTNNVTCHVEVHDRPDPSLGIAVNKATVQQCRSYLYIKEKGVLPNDNNKNVTTTAPSSSSSSFSLCEIQSIPCDYGSFLLRQNPSFTTTTTPMIVGDGSLYTITRMDPLFFLLTADRLTAETSGSVGAADAGQWQPLEQILDALHDVTLVSCLKSNPKQLKHLYDELNLGSSGGGDVDIDNNDSECFYKFSVTKALVWLKRKQEAVQQVLLQQLEKQVSDLKKKKKLAAATTGTTGTTTTVGGSFCSTFNMIQDDNDMTTKTSSTALSIEQQQAATTLRSQQEEERRVQRQETRARDESIQIVCNYLDEDNWKGAFLKHLQISDDVNEVNKILWGKTTTSSSINNNNKRPASTTTTTTTAATCATSNSSSTKTNPSSTTAAAAAAGNNNNNVNKKLKQTAKSAGVKRLEKASLGKNKGIQKMTSFFQAIPSKKKTTTKENTINDQQK